MLMRDKKKNKTYEEKKILDNIQKRVGDTPLFKINREISRVKNNNRLLVLVSHGFVELLINALIDHHLKNNKKITNDERLYPHSTKLLILNELGIIDDNRYKIFNWFRKLRNRAAHQPLFEVTKKDLQHIGPKKYQDLNNFYDLCIMQIVGSFWNEHVPVFAPLFAPGMGDGREYEIK